MSLKPYLILAADRPLDRAEARAAFDIIMSGAATEIEIAGFLMALRVRGETVDEIAGAAAAMRAKALPVSAPANAMDIVGTGGDGKGTLNISTASALVVASAGIPMAKHGNKALSSKAGASDALSALGVILDCGVPVIETCIREAGIGYMAAPNHHAAMRHVMPVRQGMGVRTVFNILGPLTNPAGVKRQLTGAFSAAMLRPMAETLQALGSEAAWLVHGGDGTDELSIAEVSTVVALKDGAITEFQVSPEDAGLTRHPFEAIIGGTPDENAKRLAALLDGAQDAYRDAVLLNSAAALVVAGAAQDLREGARRAAESIDSGKAKTALDALIRLTTAR